MDPFEVFAHWDSWRTSPNLTFDICHGQFAPPSVNGLSSQQQRPRGMLCLIMSVLPHQCYSSEVDSRQNYSRVHTSNLTEFVSASVTQHFCP